MVGPLSDQLVYKLRLRPTESQNVTEVLSHQTGGRWNQNTLSDFNIVPLSDLD